MRLQSVTSDQKLLLKERETFNKKYLEEKRSHDETQAQLSSCQTENHKLKGDIQRLEQKFDLFEIETQKKMSDKNSELVKKMEFTNK